MAKLYLKIGTQFCPKCGSVSKSNGSCGINSPWSSYRCTNSKCGKAHKVKKPKNPEAK